MNRYRLCVQVEVDVECFDEADAVEFMEDALGVGDYAGYQVSKFQVVKIQEA